MEQKQIKKQQKEDEGIKAQAYYVPESIPAEIPSKNKGIALGVTSVIAAVLSLLFYPLVLGVVGVTTGVLAINKGSNTLGVVGIVLSAIFMTIGIILSVLFTMNDVDATGNIFFGVFL